MATPKIGEVVGFIGPKGSGKTYGATRYLSKRSRVILFDANAEFSAADGVICEDRADLINLLRGGAKRVVWRGCDTSEGVDWGARAAIAWGRCSVLFNEAETLLRGRNMPASVETILRRSRHVKVNCIWTAQRPTNLHPDFRQNADKIFFFAGYEPTYTRFLEEMVKKEAVQKLAQAPDFTPLLFENGKEARLVAKFS